ncbi:MAG: hypothetical protein QMC23_03345 [Rubritalea sp.]|jgi:hypothetical protein
MSLPFLDKKTKTKSKPRSKSNKSSQSNSSRRRIQAGTSSPSSPSLISLLTKYTSIILILLLGTGALLYIKRDQWGISALFQKYLTQENKPKPDPAKYASLIAQLNADRSQLKNRYLSAETRTIQQQIISEASTLLEDRLPPMMRCWLGHPWDFNGIATIPGEGEIACGYFVSTIMRDAGFKINRIRVAQQPSQNIIRTFVDNQEFYEIKTNTPYQKYVDDITKNYQGIQIVGLDKHVAFIVIKDGQMRFIHSGGLQKCVVDEGRSEAHSLENSNYRVISNISRNRNAIKKWILGKPFSTGGSQAAAR